MLYVSRDRGEVVDAVRTPTGTYNVASIGGTVRTLSPIAFHRKFHPGFSGDPKLATQATISLLPKDAKWVERYRACDYCSGRSVGVLMSDRNEMLGVTCESCAKLALAQRRVRA